MKNLKKLASKLNGDCLDFQQFKALFSTNNNPDRIFSPELKRSVLKQNFNLSGFKISINLDKFLNRQQLNAIMGAPGTPENKKIKFFTFFFLFLNY